MQRLPINLLESGMVVAKQVLNDKGMVLVSEGTELDDRTITRLENMGVTQVMVRGYPVKLAGYTPKGLAEKLADLDRGFSRAGDSKTMARLKVLVKSHFIRREEAMRAGEEATPEPIEIEETEPETLDEG